MIEVDPEAVLEMLEPMFWAMRLRAFTP